MTERLTPEELDVIDESVRRHELIRDEMTVVRVSLRKLVDEVRENRRTEHYSEEVRKGVRPALTLEQVWKVLGLMMKQWHDSAHAMADETPGREAAARRAEARTEEGERRSRPPSREE